MSHSQCQWMASRLKKSPNEKMPSISKNVAWNGVLPTFSMSPVRMHFWQVVARVSAGSPRPRNSRLNWFIPAGVNSTVGSFGGTSTSLGLRRQPLVAKKSRYDSRTSSVVMAGTAVGLRGGSGRSVEGTSIPETGGGRRGYFTVSFWCGVGPISAVRTIGPFLAPTARANSAGLRTG